MNADATFAETRTVNWYLGFVKKQICQVKHKGWKNALK